MVSISRACLIIVFVFNSLAATKLIANEAWFCEGLHVGRFDEYDFQYKHYKPENFKFKITDGEVDGKKAEIVNFYPADLFEWQLAVREKESSYILATATSAMMYINLRTGVFTFTSFLPLTNIVGKCDKF